MTAMAAPAYAQDTDAEAANDDDNVIIVTATKRDSSIKDVPFSINAQTQEDIQRSGSTNLEDISRNVAGLSIQNLGPGQSQVSVRGVSAGQIVRDQPGVKEQVGVYLDESVISLSLFTPDLDLFDLNRVETLRGPQGTLFGSGSVGGTVRYITNQPQLGIVEGSVEGNVNLVDGDDFGGSLKGAVNLPLGDSTAVRLVGYYTRYGGFIDALGEGGSVKEDVNDGERYGGRIAIAFQAAPDVTITPRLVYQKIKTGGFNRQEIFNLYGNPFTTTRPTVNFEERQQYLLLDESFEDETIIGDLTINASWDGLAATSVTSYTDRDILVSRDASALTGSVSVDLGYPDAGVLLPSNLRDVTKVQSLTQEIRLASDYISPFQWVIGGFYANTQRDYAQTLPTPGYDAFTDATLGAGTAAATNGSFGPDSPFNSVLPYDLKQLAIFGEGTYDLTDAFHVTVGARYYDYVEERRFTTGGLFSNGDDQRDKTRSNGVTPRVLLAYDVSDDVTVNAQASKGFRLGGVNDPLNLPLCSAADASIFGGFQDYGDETLWNYEAGVKVQSGNFSFNAAGFYTDISNLQVTLDAGSCSSRVVFNVPEAHTVGLEFETTVSPAEGLAFGVSGSYVEAEFDSTVVDGTGAVLGGIREGNRLPSVPKFQISGNASYSFPVGEGAEAYFAGSVQHVGSRFTQPSDQENNPRSFVSGLPFGGAPGTDATVVDLKLPAYQIVNLSAGIDFDSGLSVIAYVNNLLDENALLSFDRERGGRARLAFRTNQPRTFGLTVRQDF
ncbi:TonB-dependent receptor [Sphingorhabdus sp. Alg239-R122]|uniref:TonB-dependent receptor n=1 Tax=Sphingorhabdus sp. Alg239-R122 TaxID=2305989 RepID=UPI0019676C24|nr:TonB-dependent receptor [Sphingorhabdus sp. Alg239-R122]